MNLSGSANLPSADYYDVEALLSPRERAKLAELREFLAAEVAPYAQGWWDREEFPFDLVPKLGALGLSTPHRSLPHRPAYSRLFQ